MMLAGFQQYGLNPGPLLFAERPDLVWGLIASLFIANTMLLVLNLPLVGLWVRLLADPAALALCRHPGLRDHGHDCGQAVGRGTHDAGRASACSAS